MKRTELPKLKGQYLRLQPAARGSRGEECDDEWVGTEVVGEEVRLVNLRTRDVAVLGADHIHSYFTDPSRTTGTTTAGFLQLHVRITLSGSEGGRAQVTPLPPPRQGAGPEPLADRVRPLVVHDGREDRFFSWAQRDPIHLIPREEEPRQLYDFYVTLCDELRIHSTREPAFQGADDIRGDIVYELPPDLRARWRLLGGAGGRAARQVLVLTEKPARPTKDDDTSVTFSAACGKGHSISWKSSKSELKRLLAGGTLELFCMSCGDSRPATPEEVENLKRQLRSGSLDQPAGSSSHSVP